ncbi:thiamine pyrophosphate-dependent enzyme, partial [Chlamydiales bacterium]|nr:thiamine pyrophosphate-dependent enzyme [Chlamydiales bacterium]
KIPHAAGAAYAMKVKGEKSCSLCYFGDGAVSEGDFHAGLNFAAVRKAPVIFFCRNNGYAISTKVSSQSASLGIVEKAPGYGIEGVKVDGNDVFALYDVIKKAKEHCLSGKGAILIEAMTYRMGAHSTSDDPSSYRDQSQVEEWKEKCPIKRLKIYLEKRDLWNDMLQEALVTRIQEEITTAIKVAKSTPPPPKESVIEDVYKEVPESLKMHYNERLK